MLASAGVHSIATFDQSASISSATMSGSDVIDPWPISAPALRIVILPSAAMRTHGLIGAFAKAFACACDISRTPSFPTAMQNAIPPKPAITPRREISRSIMFMAQAALDGRDDAVIGSAAADIVVHVGDDIGAGGLRVLCEKFRRLHDLARLAVAALRHLFHHPRLLQRMRGGG